MDFIFLDYKDPLFGLIIFFILIFIVSISNYSWASITKNKNTLIVKRFLAKLPHIQTSNTYNDDILLIKSYIANTMYQQAINKILTVLNSENKNYHQLLDLLSLSYLKLGLLNKSKEICIEHLKMNPRNTEILKRLFYIYNKNRDFKSMQDISNVLNAQKYDTKNTDIYINYLMLKQQNKSILYNHKISNIFQQKLFLTYMIDNQINIPIDIDIHNHLDIFLAFNSNKLEYLDSNILHKLENLKPKFNYKISFECKSCKQKSWIKSEICSKCYNVDISNIIFEYKA